jgi:hypothetical protein
LLPVLIPWLAFADIIVFHSGKPMEVEQAWEEGDKIFFYLKGFKASISKQEVLRIERKIIGRGDSSGNSKKTKSPSAKVADIAKKDSRQAKVNTSPQQRLPPKPPEITLNHSKTRITKKDTSSAKVNKSPKQMLHSKPPKITLDHSEQEGFRDLNWGANLAALKNFVELKSDTGLAEVKEYIREGDKLKLGDADLKSIVYSFWRDQFYTVTVWTEGKTNYISLRNEAFKKFGTGQRSDQSLERYLWSDASTDRMLKFMKDTQVGMLWMRSKKIDRRYKLTKLNVPSSYLKSMKSRD